jgi:hypothetical protein
MSDVHALVGAYAVDAVDDVERVAFERHLASCQACQLELEGLHETAALLGSSEPVAPPSRLRDQVLAGIETVRPLPPVTTPIAAVRQRRFRPATLVAAAAAVIALGAGATIWQPWADEPSQGQQLTAAERVLAAPDAEEYSQALPDGTEVTIVRSRSRNEAVLVADDMPPAPSGKVYELWLEHEDVGMVSAGTMKGTEDQVVLEGDPATAVGAGITVEPAPGSEEPTLPPVMTFAFENT